MEPDYKPPGNVLWIFPPFLRLYDENEIHLRIQIMAAMREHDHNEEFVNANWTDPRYWVVRRFFGSIVGFHAVRNIFSGEFTFDVGRH
jgi:hypothetical protein